jgi:hypothetical protein
MWIRCYLDMTASRRGASGARGDVVSMELAEVAGLNVQINGV